MGLQNILNRAWHEFRKTTLGVAFGFSLVATSEIAYGQSPIFLPPPPIFPPLIFDPFPPIPPPEDESESLPEYERSRRSNNLDERVSGVIDEEFKSLREKLKVLSPEKVERILKYHKINMEYDIQYPLYSCLPSLDYPSSHPPSLKTLQEDYTRVMHNAPNQSLVYKAKTLPGYYVHYPEAERIYYVERQNGMTVPYSITAEDGIVLFYANEKGKMIKTPLARRLKLTLE